MRKTSLRRATGHNPRVGRAVFAILLLFSCGANAVTLKDCIELGYKNNPSVVAAKENVNAASAKMGQAASAVLPSVGLSATKGKNYSQPMTITLPPVFGGGTISTAPDEVSDYTSYSLNVQQPLFSGGKILTGLAIARSGYDIAVEELRKTSQEVEFAVTKAYYDYIKSGKHIEIMESSIANLKRNLAITQVLFDSGIATESDVLRIKTAIANYNVLKIQAKSGHDIALLALNAAIGIDLPAGTELEDDFTGADMSSLPSEKEAVSIALLNRPDYLSFKQALKVADSAVSLAYSGYLPNIAFSYSSGNTKNEYHSNTSSNSNLNNWRAMFVGSWTLFDGFKTENQVREAFASLNAAKAQEKAIEDGIKLDVSSSHINLSASSEKLAAAQLAAELASRALKSIEVSYGANISSRQMYLETQTTHLVAVTDFWNAKCDLEIAKAKMNKATGKKII